MGCLTAPSHRSVRMKFVVILSFLLLGVVLGDPRYGYGGYRGGYRGRGGYYGGRVRYGKRSADADAAPVADAYRYRGYGGYRGHGGRGYGGYRSYGKRDAEPEPRRYGGYYGGSWISWIQRRISWILSWLISSPSGNMIRIWVVFSC